MFALVGDVVLTGVLDKPCGGPRGRVRIVGDVAAEDGVWGMFIGLHFMLAANLALTGVPEAVWLLAGSGLRLWMTRQLTRALASFSRNGQLNLDQQPLVDNNLDGLMGIT